MIGAWLQPSPRLNADYDRCKEALCARQPAFEWTRKYDHYWIISSMDKNGWYLEKIFSLLILRSRHILKNDVPNVTEHKLILHCLLQ